MRRSKQKNKEEKSREQKSRQPKQNNKNSDGREPKDCITISRYGEKDQRNIFSFPIARLMTEFDFDSVKTFPEGFPGSQYFITVNELVIEWENDQNEVCGYVECLDCEDEVLKNQNRGINWVEKNPKHYDLEKDKQILRFVKPSGEKITIIKIENQKYYGLELEGPGMHEIECAIKPMFDENEVLPIKNAHITVEIKIDFA